MNSRQECVTMKFGLMLPQTPQFDLRQDVASIAGAAEAAGYSSLWSYERTLFPLVPKDGLYGIPGLPWAESYRSTADPLTVLTLAAAATSTVRLGTCVLVAGLHQSYRLARTFATLDQATGGGRTVAGLGAGWSQDEFLAVGAAFADRGRSLEETVDALKALWAGDPVTYEDSRMAVDNALVSPKPLAPIPVMIGGGNTPKSLDRIARKADGWIPSGLPTPALAQLWDSLRELATSHGRAEDAIRMTPLMLGALTESDAGPDRTPFCGSIAQVVSDFAEVANVGPHEAIIAIGNASSAPELSDKAAALLAALDEQGLVDR
jgi:probable F420-dependent oxidoreductase